MGDPQAFISEVARLRRGSQPAPNADRESAWASGSQHGHNSLHQRGSTKSFIPDDVEIGPCTQPIAGSTPFTEPETDTGPKPHQRSTRPGEYFCADCQQAKRQPDYAKRLKHILSKTLWCNGCRAKHYLVLFDASDWSDDPATNAGRKCFVHKARFRLCPHVSMTLAELEETDWNSSAHTRKSGSVFIQCEHPDHRPRRKMVGDTVFGAPWIQIRPRTGKLGLRSLHFGVTLDPWKSSDLRSWNQGEDNGGVKAWSNHLATHDEVHFGMEAEAASRRAICISEIVNLFGSSSFLACSHLRRNPDQLRQRTSPGLAHDFACSQCSLYIDIEDPDQKVWVDPISLSGYWSSSLDSTSSHRTRQALEILDPDSHGTSDIRTKHITWCDDSACATTFEGIRASLLRYHAVNPEFGDRTVFEIHERLIFPCLTSLSRVEDLDIATLYKIQWVLRGTRISPEEGRDTLFKQALALYGFKPVSDKIVR